MGPRLLIQAEVRVRRSFSGDLAAAAAYSAGVSQPSDV